jgi:hypothetical protein
MNTKVVKLFRLRSCLTLHCYKATRSVGRLQEKKSLIVCDAKNELSLINIACQICCIKL